MYCNNEISFELFLAVKPLTVQRKTLISLFPRWGRKVSLFMLLFNGYFPQIEKFPPLFCKTNKTPNCKCGCQLISTITTTKNTIEANRKT